MCALNLVKLTLKKHSYVGEMSNIVAEYFLVAICLVGHL